MYAVIDIETTGGKYNQEGITEIAIYRFDGTKVVDQFISLVNPEIPIQPFVSKLTGINNAMLRSAPKFYEIAKRIVEITANCVIIAHNADFDYRILQLEFKRLGYRFSMPTLCTVELSKQLIPQAPSYSLGKLARSLGIPVSDRHRANGDALAALKLFQLLLAKDVDKKIVSNLVKKNISDGINSQWSHILDQLPYSIGVFYIHNYNGEVIYLAKSNNINKRVSELFTNQTLICKRIQNEVHQITFEETGNELISSLKEREELNKIKPKWSNMQRKSPFLWGLYAEKQKNGIYSLKISKIDGRKNELHAFKNIQQAENYFHDIQLWIKDEANQQGKSENDIIKQFIANEQNKYQNTIIILKGRSFAERSALVIKDGILQGYCFFELNHQINKEEILQNILIPLQHSKTSINMIKNYLQNKTDYKLVSF